jgi:hypothetical protein
MFAVKRADRVSVSGTSVDIDDLSAWSATSGYAFGATPKVSTAVFYCIKDYASPVNGERYKPGDYVYFGSKIYNCIVEHVMEDSKSPTGGADYLTYWEEYAATSTAEPVSGSNTAEFWFELTESTTTTGSFPLTYYENTWSTWNLDYITKVPRDFIRMMGWEDLTSVVRQEGDYFLADKADPGILYIKNSVPIRQYPSHFIEAFCDKLAADACFMLTGSSTKAEKLIDYYTAISIKKAKSRDSQGETPQAPQADAWINAKYSGEVVDGKQQIRYR